jgi:MFS family permease
VTLFLVNGVSLVLAALSEGRIQPPAYDVPVGTPTPAHPDRPALSAMHSFRERVSEGFAYVRRQPGMMVVVTSCAVLNAILMPVSVLLPVYATTYLRVDVRWYGFLLAAIAAGSLVGSVSIGAVAARLIGSSRRLMLVAAFTGMALGMMALAQIRLPLAALMVLFLMGVLTQTINVLTISIVQRATAREFRGRVMGTLTTITRLLVPVALVGGGAVADATGRNVPLIYSMCGAATLVTVAILSSRRARVCLASA